MGPKPIRILRTMAAVVLAALLTATMSGLSSKSDTQNAQSVYTISDNVDLVLLDVSVKDPRAAYVTALHKTNLQIPEDGHPRPITQSASVDTPVTVGPVLANSGTMI